jgi:hypothetical protein
VLDCIGDVDDLILLARCNGDRFHKRFPSGNLANALGIPPDQPRTTSRGPSGPTYESYAHY